MVHWLGEGTNVMLCLAREPPPSPSEEEKSTKAIPSSVYISYDNGDTFEEKTSIFTVERNNTKYPSVLDQFSTHPNYNTVSLAHFFAVAPTRQSCRNHEQVFLIYTFTVYRRSFSLMPEIKRFSRIQIMDAHSHLIWWTLRHLNYLSTNTTQEHF